MKVQQNQAFFGIYTPDKAFFFVSNTAVLIDPACDTFGFMIAAHQYVSEQTDEFYDLDANTAVFERTEAFTGTELMHDTHRLALMNAMLHNMEGTITLGDTLSNLGKSMRGYDVVLTNPPFGTKKSANALPATTSPSPPATNS